MGHARIQMDSDSSSTFGTQTWKWNHMELTTRLQCFKAGAINKFYGIMEHQIFPASGPAGSRWPEALSLLDTMQRADVQRDVVAWNAVMSACENLGECLLSMMER